MTPRHPVAMDEIVSPEETPSGHVRLAGCFFVV
jgi:hypothetical protein